MKSHTGKKLIIKQWTKNNVEFHQDYKIDENEDEICTVNLEEINENVTKNNQKNKRKKPTIWIRYLTEIKVSWELQRFGRIRGAQAWYKRQQYIQ